MVKLSYTLFGIVFLALAARTLPWLVSLNMKLINAVLKGNSTGSAAFSPFLLTHNMLVFSAFTGAGPTAKQINEAMMFFVHLDDFTNATRDLNSDYMDRTSEETNEFRAMGKERQTNSDNIGLLKDEGTHLVPVGIRIESAWFVGKDFLPDEETEKALATLNKWITQNTNQKIEFFINETSPDMKINLVLTAYFNAEWKYAFDPKLTKKVDFHTSANTVTPVDMMSITGEFVLEYIKAIDTDVLHLPFKQKHLKMTLLVPRKIDGINTLIQNLTMVHMTNLHRRGKARPVNVQLPKFKIDSEDDLKKPMQDLGIHDLFSNVNISKLATSKGPLKVDHIIQRVVLDVDERGAEVAFASRTSLKPQHIVVDRPFLFLVREDNDVYFAGRVNFTP